jgi:4-hydroxybenzoate polyprenyltransferase
MLSRLRTYLAFVRFSHSVFALPFAFAGALLASRQTPITWPVVAWILVAMVAARSAAMGFNRLVDARLDGLNPRTANREIPRGAMSYVEATLFVVIASAVFVYASWRLNPICFALSPVALSIVFWYSLAKRFDLTQLFSAWPWPLRLWAAGWLSADAPVKTVAARHLHRHVGGGFNVPMPVRCGVRSASWSDRFRSASVWRRRSRFRDHARRGLCASWRLRG